MRSDGRRRRMGRRRHWSRDRDDRAAGRFGDVVSGVRVVEEALAIPSSEPFQGSIQPEAGSTSMCPASVDSDDETGIESVNATIASVAMGP